MNSSLQKKKPKFIVPIIALTVTTVSVVWFFFLFSGTRNDLRGGKNISGTNFTIYKDKVYVAIPSNGYYLVADADPHSITTVQSQSNARQLAKDNNHVFCGNKIIPQLNPNNITASFNGYIADNHYAYYCDTAKRNLNSTIFEEIIGAHKTTFDSDKPETYYNELIKLETSSPNQLMSVTGKYAKDNNSVYYKGRKIENADPNTIKKVTQITPGLSERKSNRYLEDKNHLYYKGVVLANAAPENVKIYNLQESDLYYAHDLKTDQFYVGSHPFPGFIEIYTPTNENIEVKLDSKAPQKQKSIRYNTDHLQFLNVTNKHANHDLFFNSVGVFYWNHREKTLMLACATPFSVKQINILSDGFVADENNGYFLRAADEWGTGKNKGLQNRQTQIIKIDNITAKNWIKFANVKNQYASPLGTIWQANNDFYFEAYTSKANGFKSTLYKMKNIDNLIPEKLELPKDEKLYTLKIEDKQLSNYLDQIDGEIVCVAKTNY